MSASELIRYILDEANKYPSNVRHRLAYHFRKKIFDNEIEINQILNRHYNSEQNYNNYNLSQTFKYKLKDSSTTIIVKQYTLDNEVKDDSCPVYAILLQDCWKYDSMFDEKVFNNYLIMCWSESEYDYIMDLIYITLEPYLDEV